MFIAFDGDKPRHISRRAQAAGIAHGDKPRHVARRGLVAGDTPTDQPRQATRQVWVGGVPIGGGADVTVQSMLTAHTDQPQAALSQIAELAAAGCELIRVAVPDKAALPGFAAICAESPLPVIADIHFDYRLAIEAARLGAAKLRINPGNIGDLDMVDAIIDAAGEAGIPIRIGVNAGSLAAEEEGAEGAEGPGDPEDQGDPGDPADPGDPDDFGVTSLAQRLASSAERYVQHFFARGFNDVVVSAKAHDVPTTVAAYRLLSQRLPQVPLHLG
ncbi:MAG: flavodoxin-dependent (E)-4-hydroxy-3-methylbut-2-enyl-diphosphate synthase, partial [Coriobacteriia bacterium]|nr:flavodoxin-dependent (E)-4-hydroxy-3-methylbut-2-enyl-diphosphate synthase [Coriobacteriia bacterium]